MHIKIALIILSLIAAAVGGTIVLEKTVFKPKTPVSGLPSVILKANDVNNSTTIAYNTPVILTWTSNNAARCSASGDWYGIVSVSGSEPMGNLIESKNYTLTCVNDKDQRASNSVAVNIDEKTIFQATSTISIRDLFGDFRYFWKKNLYLGMKNNADVIALQTVLLLEGLLLSPDQITGNFDEETLEALKKFQENYDIESTGYAGTKTITKLNELYGNYDLAFYPETQQPAYQTPSSPQQILGANFQLNDAVVNIDTLTLRDESCNQISILSPNTSMIIISEAVRFCNIGGKSYEMRNVKVISTGQIGWVASFSLKKIGVFNPTGSPTSPISAGPRPSVDLKVQNSDGPITLPYNTGTLLTWISYSAKSCTAYGGWSGEKSLTGSEPTGNLTRFKYYTLTCTNDSGFNSDSVIVYVNSPTSTPIGGGGTKDEFDDDAGDTSAYAPKITDFKPKVGPSGTVVKVEGENFAPHDNEVHTNFDKMKLIKEISSDDSKSLKFVVIGPAGGLQPGTSMPIKFYIKNDVGRSNTKTFYLLNP